MTSEPMAASVLDARVEAERLRTMYADDPRQNSFRVLVTGESGTGKTHLLRTARKPVHIDSFDPGGTLVLRDLIAKGDIVADTKYELEDRMKPTMFREWTRDFERRYRSKYFESFATYCLDSTTMWADAIMSYIMVKRDTNSGGGVPNFYRDYNPQKIEIQNWMRRILTLPCDVIVTGHLEEEYSETIRNRGSEDEEVIREIIGYKYMTTGKAARYVPLLFDEQWTLIAQEKGTGTEYKLLTAPWRKYKARSRLGRGVFSTFEEPDIGKLLKKTGWDVSNKPKLF